MSLLKKMNKSSSTAWNNAWKSQNIGGSISSILGGTSGILEAGMANAQIKDTSAEESHIEGVENTQFSTGNLDSLMNQFDATAMARNNFTRQEVRGLSDGQMAGNIFKGAASGALAGAQVGGIWGGIGGFFAGMGSGIAGIAVGNKRAREKANQLNKDAQLANASYINNFSNSVENTENTMFNNSLLNITAYGGPMYKFTGDFTNGLTFIDAGGTHERNPFGGVQVGVDYEGAPNLVEEGEVIYNDYVFSNRLKPTKKQLADGGFKDKYDGYTFAKLVEDVSKPYMDTPNDPITKAGLEDMMNRIITMQEEIRAKKGETNNFRKGGKLNLYPKYGSHQRAKFAYDAGSRDSEAVAAVLPNPLRPGIIIGKTTSLMSNVNGDSDSEFNRIFKTTYDDGIYNLSEMHKNNEDEYIHTRFGLNNGDSYHTYNKNGELSDYYETDYANALNMKKLIKPNNKFNKGGIIGNVFDGGSWLPYDNSKGFSYFNQNEYDQGYLNWLNNLSYDNNKDLIDDIASYYNTNIDPDATTGKDFVSTVQRLGQDKKFGEIHKKLGNAYTNSRLKDVNVDTDFSNVFNFEDITPEEIDITFDGSDLIQPTSKNKGFNWGSLGRYASIAADSAGLITNSLKESDYTNAEAGVKAMREVPMVESKPVGNYLQLDRIDRNYLLNPLMASSRSSARNIQNQGLNAGQTQAALLANQYNTNRGIGQAIFEADRENMNRVMQEAQFNLGINQYNANQAMQAQQMNQQRAYNIAQAEAQAAQMREAIDAQKAAAINQNISGLTEGLAGIGQEAVYKDWLGALVDKDAIQDVFGTPKVKTKKCGGKLLTKKRK